MLAPVLVDGGLGGPLGTGYISSVCRPHGAALVPEATLHTASRLSLTGGSLDKQPLSLVSFKSGTSVEQFSVTLS